MATPVFCCGFECGTLYDISGHSSHFSGNLEIVTDFKRSGSRAARCIIDNDQSDIHCTLAGVNMTVARFYIYFEELPGANCFVAWTGVAAARVGLAFKLSDSKLYCASGNTPSFAAAGFAITTGVWYRVDIKLDQTSGAKTVDAIITPDDGEETSTALPQKTSADATAPASFFLGVVPAIVSGEYFFDDVTISNTSGDYPLGPGSINAFVPKSDGSHNIAGADDFERGNTGTDITNATTTAYQLIDDLPLPSVPDNVDAIRATAPANATDYVEVKFGPGPDVSTPTDPPQSINAIVCHHQPSSVSGNIRVALADNGSTDDILNFTGNGSNNQLHYAFKHYINPPSPAAEWTLEPGDGNFFDVRMRFYSSDANPAQYLDAAMIEADFPLFNGEPLPEPGGYYACAGTLPTFQTADQDKIDELRALRAAGDPIGQVFELAKISWPSPDGDIYYAVLQTDEVATVAPPVSPIETRLIPDDDPAWFMPVQLDATIGDEEVDLELWDGDGVISDLLVDHGEGIKVELFYWFPEVELLLPLWHGHLRQEDEAEIDICRVKAVQGFRSSDSFLPRRAHYKECQAIFGAVFDTQAEIDEHDCPYNKHIGGSVGNFESGSTPYTSCPRRTRADCIARLGNDGNYMLSHATIAATVANGQTKGPTLYSTSFGNETNLKEPVRVVMGERRVHQMETMAFRRDLNTNHPEDGWVFALYESCEGPVESITQMETTVGSETHPADPSRFRYRLGEKGQTAIDSTMTEHSYSGTAHLRDGFGWIDPSTVGASDAKASAYVKGLNNIRVYTDEETYTEEFTSNRAWHIMRMLTDKRWGYGYDHDRLDIPSFIEAACWCSNVVQFTDFNGDTFNHIRSLSNVELKGRKVQEQIEDMCMAGRLSRPFLFNGKIHIVPLREMTPAELAAAPVFTDEGNSPNIIHDEIAENVFKTTLKRSRISDLDLPNRIETTYDPADDYNLEKPVRPVEDVDAQLAAGRVVGDHSRKINIKKYPLAGVVVEEQAIKMAWSLLDVGPFDEGGLQNNLELTFKIWFLDALDLFPTRVIKVESSQITRYGFDYFRVKNIKRLGNLHVELTVQAYNDTWYAAFEELYGDLGEMPDDPTEVGILAPSPDPPPYPLDFDSVTYTGGVLHIAIPASG